MASIPEKYADLLSKEKKAFANIATLNADGTPQVTPIWFDWDGTHLIFNTAVGRVKDKNMKRNPTVAVSIMDPEQPYRYLQIQGKVTSHTEEGGKASIDQMARKYTGDDYKWAKPGETRIVFKVTPEKVQASG
jgi:PPOX class probable F420-dependent enzyme